jgi:starch-binding outer membrane protein, SusD/RagB family
MKKYIKVLLCAGIGLQTFTACDKSFLEEEVLNAYAPSTLTDAAGFEASLIGLYNHQSNLYTKSDDQGWVSVWQVGTDIVWPVQPQGIENPYYNYATLTPQDRAASYTWRWAYAMINNTNIIISNIENPAITAIPEAQKKQINAEARFFRGFAYNLLATAFGGVPLVSEPLTAPKTDFVRAPLADVNKLVLDDLLYAAENLPEISSGKAQSRANKYMAHQLLAEVYLRTDEAEKAEEQADLVINSGKFQLITARYGVKANQPGDAFSDMFVYGNQRRSQGNTEGIWVMEAENPRNVPGGMTNNPQQRRVWGAAYHNRKGMLPADSLGGRGVARIRLNDWVLYGLYEEGDMRNSQHNIRREFWYNDPKQADLFGTKVPYTGPDTLFIINPYTTKWGHFDPQDVFGFGMWKDFILMRLGETYLLKAEAHVKQGETDKAAEAVNELRRRAHAPLVSAGDMTLDLILDERVRELLGEENRRLTLMRTRTLVDRALRLNSTAPINPISGLTETHLLLPIPLSEIQLNKDAALEQNTGYTN